MSVTLRPEFPNDPGLELEWRGKPVRSLTPDEVAEFAEWAHKEIRIYREFYNNALKRAVEAERRHTVSE